MTAPASIRHLCILDPSLRDLRGHHYEYNRCVIEEARRRGMETTLYAHRDVSLEIQQQLGALPHFKRDMSTSALPPVWRKRGKLSRWLEPAAGNYSFAQDLNRLPPLANDTLVFAHTLQHWQAWALARWHRRHQLRLVMLLRYATDPQARWYSAIDSYYRLALQSLDPRRARVCTDTYRLANHLRRLTRLPVTVVPIPHVPHQPAPFHAPAAPFRVLQLGHTSSNKGVGLLADLTDELGQLPLRLRVQISSHPYGNAHFLQTGLARLRSCDAVTVLEGNLDSSNYYRELVTADAVLTVYDPAAYGGGSSGVFAESVALEKPVITSPDTWMADEIAAGHASGIVLTDYSAPALLEGLRRYTREASQLAQAARTHGSAWRDFHGAANFCDRLFAMWN